MRLNILNRQFQRSTLVIFALASFLSGIIAAKLGAPVSLQALLVGFLLTPVLLHRRLAALLVIVLMASSLGVIRGNAQLAELNRYDQLIGQKVILSGTVIDDPLYADRGQTEFHVSSIAVLEPTSQTLPGKIRVRTFTAGALRGDVVRVEAKLYQGFGSRQASMSFADVEIVARSSSPLESLRRDYFAAAYSVLPDNEASLGLGFLVGLRAALPDLLENNLSTTGLTHIVAVSGFNLTVLVRITRRTFGRKSAFAATAISFGLIASFVAITGNSPSIARASIVSGFALIGWYYGRPQKPLMLLFLGAAITAGINPLYAWGDIGWYLSFLAFFGVLILGPVFHERFIRRELGFMGQILVETTSAQLMTLPLIALIFQEVSVVSLLANAVILPLVSIAMLLMFIAGSMTLLLPTLGGWFALPARFILEFIVDMVSLLSEVSWALQPVRITAWQLAGMYALIILFVLLMQRHIAKKPKAADHTPFELV